jgi:hypothetical protein
LLLDNVVVEVDEEEWTKTAVWVMLLVDAVAALGVIVVVVVEEEWTTTVLWLLLLVYGTWMLLLSLGDVMIVDVQDLLQLLERSGNDPVIVRILVTGTIIGSKPATPFPHVRQSDNKP